MEYISVKEAAKKWGISERRVRTLCSSGRIETATRCGDWVWSIPADTPKPSDGRVLRYIRNRDLKTGTQDFAVIDKIRKSSRTAILTEYQKASIIQEAFAYDGIVIERNTILSILKLQNQNLTLETQIMILNMKSALKTIPFEITEKSICNINERLLMSIDENAGGKYSDASTKMEEIQAVMEQYSGTWSVLHPVARAAFLFSELVRISPFKKGNIQTAFLILNNEMLKAKLPPAIFGADQIPELKAALASSSLRGNAQVLVSMLIETAETK